ncbi:MAG: hypothetical protein JSS64_10105 [Bacteroidetes bacterium]|nr:hypothetical protein [Bacteroidota bacterium]
MKSKFILVTIILFVALTIGFYVLKLYVPTFRFNVLMGGNVIMAALSLLSFFIVKKSINERPQAFVQGVNSATFLKLIVCISGVLIYALLNRKDIHKPSLFMLFAIYAVYTIVEVWMLSKMAKQEK